MIIELITMLEYRKKQINSVTILLRFIKIN